MCIRDQGICYLPGLIIIHRVFHLILQVPDGTVWRSQRCTMTATGQWTGLSIAVLAMLMYCYSWVVRRGHSVRSRARYFFDGGSSRRHH